MILRARIGIAGLLDIGARFYLGTVAVGDRVAATDEGLGWYAADVGALPAEAVADHIRWDSLGDATIEARENLVVLQRLTAILGSSVDLSPLTSDLAAIKAKTDLISAGSVTVLSPVSITGNNITVRAGDSWSIPISGLGSLAGASKIWFSINKPGAADNDAKLFIERTAGLLRVNGAAAADDSLATLTVTNEAAGNISIAVDEAVTKLLGSGAQWTVKIRAGTDTRTLASGQITIAKAGVSAIA